MNDTAGKLHVDVWFDFVCPACYLAKPRLTVSVWRQGASARIVLDLSAVQWCRQNP